MATLNIPIDAFYGFLLVFLRSAAVIFSAPVLDSEAIPILFKTGLAVAVGLLLLPLVQAGGSLPETAPLAVIVAVLSEVAIGVTMGLSVKLLFAGVQMAGQIAGFQMGFAVANVVDPATSDQIPILAQFYNLAALLVFLAIDAHHLFVAALVESYALLPPFSMTLGLGPAELMINLAANMFVVAVKVGAPLIGVMLVVTVGLGLVARTVPQIHIFVVAMPLKIFVGLLFMALVMPYLVAYLVDLFASCAVTLSGMIRLMAGR